MEKNTMNALTPASTSISVANPLIPTTMEGACRLAELMSKGRLVPSHLQGQPGDCLMVIEQATRWGMSPFAVAQSTSVIQGKLMFEGKLVAAAIHASGILSDRLGYEFSGEGDTRTIIVRGTIRGEAQPRDFTLALKDAKTTNGMWTKQPDQQLVYAATRGWARRHAAEVMLGVYAPEEFDDAKPAKPFDGKTIDATVIPPQSEPAPAPPKRTWATLIGEIEADLQHATSRDAIDAIISEDRVQNAIDKAPGQARDRINAIGSAALARFPDPMTDEVEAPL